MFYSSRLYWSVSRLVRHNLVTGLNCAYIMVLYMSMEHVCEKYIKRGVRYYKTAVVTQFGLHLHAEWLGR
jgi:hypothetical protein